MTQTPTAEEFAALAAQVRTLQDRAEITDCLQRYCRGLDRLDRELALSAYHPDAIDDRGRFIGTGEEFVTWVWPILQTVRSSFHNINNITMDIQGDVAHTETYVQYVVWSEDGSSISYGVARYLDRLERRNGEWRIAFREASMDFRSKAETVEPPPDFHFASRDKTDHSYNRPLEANADALARLNKARQE